MTGNFVILLVAIVRVENPNWFKVDKVGAHGEVGPFQITPAYVQDVNTILGKEVYTLDDAKNIIKASQMFRIYTAHYALVANLDRVTTWEDLARIHNGGPKGWKKKCTEVYWKKVLEEIANVEKGFSNSNG